MDIVEAKQELYNQLKNKSEVIGAGIKGTGKNEHIVIFVLELSEKIKSIIPNSFKGIKVKVEKRKPAKIV